ncbi:MULTISPECIES: hypothetical protein [unclassified Methylophilus]|uniref:hypothetical protein n=1 Tax=unclassified Methylophilus TaxID=2630143 RepID=UPI0006FB5F69|nr:MULTISPECIES: hypothetical protein [unclassified Methylophilus]KQT42157.1 hypothetical protein ASG34_05160 [Methylophilus sp. Leaf416]KQT56338.1 hypothetical protein ASG44_05135 [Methylophilus sp. Leaf459]
MLDSLLQSEWLIRMLDKSGQQPVQKLLALFSVLDDLLSSPLTAKNQPAPSTSTADRLQKFLTTQSQKAGARLPEMLANQLYFMAISACQEKLLHPDSTALQHARQAAQALIKEQTTREINWLAVRNYGIVATALCTGILAGHFWPSTKSIEISMAHAAEQPEPAPNPFSLEASPSETAAIYGRLETMKHGECRLLEALQLPEKLKSVYIENVINGHVTTNRDEQVLVNQLLDQVQCNYTPKLMANSKS